MRVITGIVGYKCYVPLSQSIFSIPAAAHGDFNLVACVISFASALVISFIVTYLFGFDKKMLAADAASVAGNGDSIPAEPVSAIADTHSANSAVSDDAIVAMAAGEVIDVTSVSDPVFAEQVMGKSAAFRYAGDKVILCSPANGELSVLFPTGHAFGVTMKDGVELLVHCGVNTVGANGDGFRLLGKQQGDTVKAGEPIVEVDLKKLSARYDMSTMLIVTEANGKDIDFIKSGKVTRGQTVVC